MGGGGRGGPRGRAGDARGRAGGAVARARHNRPGDADSRRDLRLAMSVFRSSRAAQGLLRRLAVTPGAAVRASAPASWTQVRQLARSRRV